MKLSDRNSRLLLVISLISGLFIVGNYLFGDLNNTFNLIYSGKFVVGSEHILSSLLTAEILVIIWYALKYSYYESRTYCNYPKERKNEIQDKADICYLVLLNTIFYVFIMTILIFILSAIFSLTVFIVSAVLIVIILIIPEFIDADLFLHEFKTSISKNKFMGRLLQIYRTNRIGAITICLCIWFIMVLSYGLNIGVDGQFQPKLNLKFDNTTVKDQLILDLTFSDISPDKVPETFTIDIENQEFIETVKLEPNDFIKASIVATERNVNKDTTISQVKYLRKGIFKMNKKINMTPYLKKGKNIISIRFTVKKPLLKLSSDYLLYNEVHYNNGSIELAEEQLDIDLQ